MPESIYQKFALALLERHLGARSQRKSVFYALLSAPRPMTVSELERMNQVTHECVRSAIKLSVELGLAKEVEPAPLEHCTYCGEPLRVGEHWHWYGRHWRRYCGHCYKINRMGPRTRLGMWR